MKRIMGIFFVLLFAFIASSCTLVNAPAATSAPEPTLSDDNPVLQMGIQVLQVADMALKAEGILRNKKDALNSIEYADLKLAMLESMYQSIGILEGSSKSLEKFAATVEDKKSLDLAVANLIKATADLMAVQIELIASNIDIEISYDSDLLQFLKTRNELAEALGQPTKKLADYK